MCTMRNASGCAALTLSLSHMLSSPIIAIAYSNYAHLPTQASIYSPSLAAAAAAYSLSMLSLFISF